MVNGTRIYIQGQSHQWTYFSEGSYAEQSARLRSTCAPDISRRSDQSFTHSTWFTTNTYFPSGTKGWQPFDDEMFDQEIADLDLDEVSA